MNVRPANATMAAYVSELGGQVFQVSAPEARDALERGIADALTFPLALGARVRARTIP